jgi:hypothetical protein
VHHVHGCRAENRGLARNCTGNLQSFENVSVRLFLREGAGFATNHDSLSKLPKLWQIQFFFELRFTERRGQQGFAS